MWKGNKKEYDRARSFEQPNVPKASLPSPSLLTILHGGEERKRFKERDRKEEGARDLWLKRHGPAQSCHSLLNYNASNNSAFSHSQLQISQLGCRLPVPSPLCAGRGMCVCVCGCVCVCVCVRRPRRMGKGRRADGRGPFQGGRWQFSSHIMRQTSKPTVVI